MPTRIKVEDFLQAAQVAIANTLSTPEILTAVAVFGYDETVMQQGQALYTAALEAHQEQLREYGEQIGSRETFETLQDQVNATYMMHLKLARIALKDQPMWNQQLGLNGTRKRSFAGWLVQVQQFYANALKAPEVLQALERFRITSEMLAANATAVESVVAAKNQQEKEKSEAQRSTQVRDEAIEALNEWLSDYLAVARIALQQDPQRLEALGLVTPADD